MYDETQNELYDPYQIGQRDLYGEDIGEYADSYMGGVGVGVGLDGMGVGVGVGVGAGAGLGLGLGQVKSIFPLCPKRCICIRMSCGRCIKFKCCRTFMAQYPTRLLKKRYISSMPKPKN